MCRSEPHIPDALISKITSRGPGVGSGNSLSSSLRSPRNTTPFMASSWYDVPLILSALGQEQTSRALAPISALPLKADIAEVKEHVRFKSGHQVRVGI